MLIYTFKSKDIINLVTSIALLEIFLRAGEIDQGLRFLDALSEGLGSTPSIHMMVHNYNHSSKESDAFFLLLQALGMLGVQKHVCWQNTHKHKNKINLFN